MKSADARGTAISGGAEDKPQFHGQLGGKPGAWTIFGEYQAHDQIDSWPEGPEDDVFQRVMRDGCQIDQPDTDPGCHHQAGGLRRIHLERDARQLAIAGLDNRGSGPGRGAGGDDRLPDKIRRLDHLQPGKRRLCRQRAEYLRARDFLDLDAGHVSQRPGGLMGRGRR